jgi:carboxypeptidase C (cathepsin A)
VKSGVNTLLWAGDADAVCDWIGGLACAEAVHYPDNYEFKHKEVKNYTVNGVVKGTYKAEGTLSWLGVFEAGHYVSYFRK